MYNFLLKHGQKISFLIGLIIIVAIFIGISSGVEEFNAIQGEVEAKTAEKAALYETTMFDTGLSLTLWLLRITVFALVAFGLVHVVKNFKSSRKGLIYFGILAIIAFVAYSSVDPEAVSPTIQHALDKFAKSSGTPISPTNFKVMVGGIMTAVALLVMNAVTFALGEIYNFFK